MISSPFPAVASWFRRAWHEACHPAIPWSIRFMLALSSAAQYFCFSLLTLVLYSPSVQIDPAALSLLWTYLGWVSATSPVVGVFNDAFVLNGERRRPLMLAGVIVNVLVWSLATVLVGTGRLNSMPSLTALLAIQTLGMLAISVPLNALVVDLAAVMLHDGSCPPMPVAATENDDMTVEEGAAVAESATTSDLALSEAEIMNRVIVQKEAASEETKKKPAAELTGNDDADDDEVVSTALEKRTTYRMQRDVAAAAAAFGGPTDDTPLLLGSSSSSGTPPPSSPPRYMTTTNGSTNSAASIETPHVNDESLVVADEEAEHPVTMTVVAGNEEVALAAAAKRKAEVHGRVQSSAMVWRSLGSLVGSTIQILTLMATDQNTALGICPVLFACIGIALIFLPRRYILAGPGWGGEDHDAGLRVTTDESASSSLADTAGGRGASSNWRLTRRFHAVVTASAAMWRDTASGHCTRIHALLRRVLRGDARTARAAAKLLAVLAFVAVYSGMPDGSTAYGEYVATQYSFHPAFLAMIQGLGLVAGVASGAAYGRWFSQWQPAGVFMFGCLAAAGAYATNIALATGFAVHTLGIPAKVYVPIDTVFQAFFSRLSFMPVVHVAAQFCPEGFEGTMFEFFSTAAMGGASLGGIITAALTHHLGIKYGEWSALPTLLYVCVAAKLLPILVVLASVAAQRRAGCCGRAERSSS
jgi:hypothetical protein